MRFRYVAAVLALLAMTGAPGSGQSAGPGAQDRVRDFRGAFAEIDRLFQAFAERNRVPGIAYGVLVDGAVAHVGAWGVRDVASRAPVDPDTVFRIASMTKSFTALCILKLRDSGRLSLDDPAERYVPELRTLKYPTTDSPRLTIRHLLTHASGFPEDNPWGDQQLAASEDDFTKMIAGGIPFSNPPGVAYEYSNYGFALLGRIVSRASGMPYARYLREQILEPLGLTSTALEPAAVAASRRAAGYRWEDETWKEEPPLPDGAFGAMGGMLTSTRDLAKYVGFLMSAWPPRDGPDPGPVRRASLREMQQPWRARPATASGGGAAPLVLNNLAYGYGLGIRQTCQYRHIVSHSGGLPGFGSQMRWLVDERVGFIAMGNLTYTGWNGVFDQATELLAKTGALRRAMPAPSPALLQARADVTRLVQDWDDGLADRIAAANLFLDQSKDRRRRQIEGLRAQVGQCRADGAFEVENALRGQWTMTCERGALRVAITLAPTMPPKVQYLNVGLAPAAPAPRGCGQ
jgi:CubicO group peptidase (beta-lactamase class C family)